MAHAVYITEAIVCGSRHHNTSDRSVMLFTDRAGMVWATARGVREEKSKQRCALQDFSRIRVSLVRGKGGWRVGSVEAIENAYYRAGTKPARAGIHSVILLLRRFLHGEEPQPEIYREVQALVDYLPQCSAEEVAIAVDHFTLRLLAHLGYIAPHPAYQPLLEQSEWLGAPQALPPEAQNAISQAISVSHL